MMDDVSLLECAAGLATRASAVILEIRARGFSVERKEDRSVVTEADLPEPKVPTLYITHGVEWVGANYISNRPRGSYIGLNMNFEGVFMIPGDTKPYKYKFDLPKVPPLQVLHQNEGAPPGPGEAEEKVYEAMATDAFDQFGKRLVSNFFVVEAKK